MFFYEKMPDEQSLLDSLQEDTLGRNADLLGFYNLLKLEEGEEPLMTSIAIDGRWGSGKTFFVKQAELLIRAFNPFSSMKDETRQKIRSVFFEESEGLQESEETIVAVVEPVERNFTEGHRENPSLCENADTGVERPDETVQDSEETINFGSDAIVAVYYDAWENDNDTDPVLSILYELISKVNETALKPEVSLEKVAQRVAGIIDLLSGSKVKTFLELFKDPIKNKSRLSNFQEEHNTKEEMHKLICELKNECANRFVIFVDELDRCKPSYAVKLLEQIKHYFDCPEIVFVFSVNLNELQHTIRTYYGNDFDAYRYLDKFFHLRFQLPPANLEKFYQSVEINPNQLLGNTSIWVIQNYDLELREITRFRSQLHLAVHKNKDILGHMETAEDRGNVFLMIMVLPLMIGLYLTKASEYNQFVEGKLAQPLVDLLMDPSVDRAVKAIFGEGFPTESDRRTAEVKKVYDAIFVQRYRTRKQETIGLCTFTAQSRSFIIRTMNLVVGSDTREIR